MDMQDIITQAGKGIPMDPQNRNQQVAAGYCPSQDWERHMDAMEERQMEEELAEEHKLEMAYADLLPVAARLMAGMIAGEGGCWDNQTISTERLQTLAKNAARGAAYLDSALRYVIVDGPDCP